MTDSLDSDTLDNMVSTASSGNSSNDTTEDNNAISRHEVVNDLLAKIQQVDLRETCKKLGWIEGQNQDAPKQKHIKVAIVEELINAAKTQKCHLAHDNDLFYIYNGAYWIPLEEKEVKQLLKQAAIKMGYSQIESRDSNFNDKLFQQFVLDGFFANRNHEKQSIINLKNCSLVLTNKGVKRKEFDYRDFLTHQLDFEYNPKAENKLFLKYLAEVLPDADTRKTLQQSLGYIFVIGLKQEIATFLYGLGSNGKSVIFEVLTGVLGAENISNYSLESLTDEKGYHRIKIIDKLVNYGTDIKLNKINPDFFKTLASGEPIEARSPCKPPIIITNYAKLIFNINRLDSINAEYTQGYFRRFNVIPFNKTISPDEADKDLHLKILQDKAGVLNWMIEGAKEVIKNRNVFISQECQDFHKQFIKESDSVAMFEDECIKENQKGNIYFKTVADSYAEYKEYCSEVERKPVGRTNFSKRMEALGFEKDKKNNGWHLEKNYQKINLKENV